MNISTAQSPHQVLARKWRPRTFSQMIGQEHVLRALINALNSNRLHHAYLFTGTRGIGKTTVARILAKCLNCQQGVSATPCDNCATCLAINQGKFIDLIEVDAASRTKVEDTRELLDNVQYLPSQGRYKVYLIDEVHMLSGHSFNALLKTLEEPPAHVKFLLATTDPQRLPITILSRCLQFHLKSLSPECISAHLAHILQQEVITYDLPALPLLGKAADGSMRDALSLLDQAIAYSGGHIAEQDVRAMLGTIEQTVIWHIIAALNDNNAQALVNCCQQLAEDACDFTLALEELLSCFHQMAIAQALPNSPVEPPVANYAQLIPGEELQLYYQIGLIGRRDLPLAPTARIGFEMVLLRMLSYRPTELVQQQTLATTTPSVTPAAPVSETVEKTDLCAAIDIEPIATSLATEADPIKQTHVDWLTLLPQLKLSGLSYTLASHCLLTEMTEQHVHLLLEAPFSAMLSAKLQQNLSDAFQQYLGKAIKLTITIAQNELETPALLQKRRHTEQHQAALTTLQTDPGIQLLTQQFDAKLDLASLKLKPINK